MSEDKYNGWTNRETWAVKLHWDNNEGDYLYFTEQAEEFKKAGKKVWEFADHLKEAYEEMEAMIFEGEGTGAGKLMVQDVGSAWRVDWCEIAEAYYNEVEEVN